MRFAGARFAEDEERAPVSLLDMFWRARSRHLAVKDIANLCVNGFDIEWITRVDLRAVCDRSKHLGPVRATECNGSRIEPVRA